MDRPAEIAELERVLLPRKGLDQRQQIHVLHGLGGIGKTQLAVEFARRHHRRFSSVFWLDGRSEDILKRSIAACAIRIPKSQIPETSKLHSVDGDADINVVVKDVMSWLALPNNTTWLLIFDNVDREFGSLSRDPEAYDIRKYLSGADHGSVLVTTRLARLEQLGESQHLNKVTKEQGRAILLSWYKNKWNIPMELNESIGAAKTDSLATSTSEVERLLELLDGLPLAIAQAGAYLQQSGIKLTAYLRLYEQHWGELIKSKEFGDDLLQDYPDRSVWTTWAMSYQAIRSKHEPTANLLLLWSFLDNKDLWHGLFAGCQNSSEAREMLPDWVGRIASSELEFNNAMQLLRNYSLIEEAGETTKYATHPVVHRWAYHYQGKQYASKLGQLAIITVGYAIPDDSVRDYWSI